MAAGGPVKIVGFEAHALGARYRCGSMMIISERARLENDRGSELNLVRRAPKRITGNVNYGLPNVLLSASQVPEMISARKALAP